VKGLLRVLVVLCCLLSCGLASATTVIFLNPGRSNEPFWVSYTNFMQAAADSLGMQLQVLYSERDPQTVLRQARAILDGGKRPDYLLFVNEHYAAPEILRMFEPTAVKLFSLHSTLTADQQQLLGRPREKFPNWIGSLVPNDEEAGYLMAKALFALKPGQQELLAFSGNKQTPSATLRESGLQRALSEHPDVRLRQLVYGEWNRQRAYEQARLLLPRYPQVHLIWSANDEMAFGAMRALEEQGGKPGKDALFTALNNSPEVLQARLDGRVSVLVGGHFTLGGWAMVLLHDYAAGLDFAERGGKDRVAKLHMLLDQTQTKRMLRYINQGGNRLDFRRFSAVHHPQIRDYQFSVLPLLE